jgi:Cys-tRNA synthase (O-phospho-L-seryl-tRNA:Cys-tRNA synthase)
LEIITFAFPTTRGDLVSRFRNHIQGLEREPGTKVVAVIDGIISVPGAHIPWEEMVKICHENDVISIVDAAHMIGQTPIDVQKSDPDFLVTVGTISLEPSPTDMQTELPQVDVYKTALFYTLCPQTVQAII